MPTNSTIRTEFVNIQLAYDMLLADNLDSRIPNLTCGMQKLANLFTTLPSTSTSISTILDSWPAEEIADTDHTELGRRIHQATVMYQNYAVWHWLEVFIPSRCIEWLAPSAILPRDWLADLVRDVQQYLSLRVQVPQTFFASAYGLGFHLEPCTLGPSNRPLPSVGRRRNDVIISAIKRVLRYWLGYPTPDINLQRACFIHVMVTEYGVGTLYLNGVWATYNSLAGRSINVGPWRVTNDFKTLFRYNNHSSSHPLDDPTSMERTAVVEIASIFDTFKHLPSDGRLAASATSETLALLDPDLRNLATTSIPMPTSVTIIFSSNMRCANSPGQVT